MNHRLVEFKKILMPLPLTLIGKIAIKGNIASFSFQGKKLSFSLSDKDAVLNGIRLRTWELGLLETTFFREEYAKLQVENADVIDLGSAIGDTAIYFASKGARHVYGFELDGNIAKISKANIELNRLSDKITISDSGKYTLEEIASKSQLNNAVLKSDCEGYEYELIIKAQNETLRRFKEMILEYHNGSGPIVKKLKEAGFETSILSQDTNLVGILYAKIANQI